MKTARTVLIKPVIKSENIVFSGAKSPAATPAGLSTNGPPSNVFHWDLVTAGNCSLLGANLELVADGWAYFDANLTSSGSGDSWGILQFNLRQANGLIVFTAGPFWSGTADQDPVAGPWYFRFQYPQNLFDIVASVDFVSHC
jgi:hypothetical protein